MKITHPTFEILTELNGKKILEDIERIGRTCYKSEDSITTESSENFIRMLMKRGHLSVIEHFSFSVRFVFDRGVSHEMVRHRLASFSQESTRYCNYTKDKFGNEITVIDPTACFLHGTTSNAAVESAQVWKEAMENAEKAYLKLIELGESPQMARSVLPNSLKTEIVVTANLREWRTILSQRTAAGAHPQMRQVMLPLLDELQHQIPLIFEDIKS